MRIALLCRAYQPLGEATKLVVPLMSHLSEAGWEVHLLSDRWPDAPGVRMIHVPTPEAAPALAQQEFAWACGEIMEREGFDLTLALEPGTAVDLFWAGGGLAEVRREAMEADRGLLGRQIAKLDWSYRTMTALEKRTLASSGHRHVVANSLKTKFELVRRYELPQDRVHVVYSGVDLDRFHPRERNWWRPETRQKLAADERELLAIFVGGDPRAQGLDLAIQALAEAFPESGAGLLVVSPSEEQPRYEAQARRLGLNGRVRFLGEVDVIQQYYSAADLCIHPARYDPFPSAVVEALACGLPVLTTPGCGGAEAIEDGKSGYIAENLSQLVDGLRLIADADRRAQMGDLARRRAQSFVQSEQIERLTSLIELVAQEKGLVVPSR